MNWLSLVGLLPIVARFVPQLAPFVPLIQGVVALLQQYAPGTVEQNDTAVPVLKSVIALVGSNMDKGMTAEQALQEAQQQISGLHKMTPDEEQAWFDRASQSY